MRMRTGNQKRKDKSKKIRNLMQSSLVLTVIIAVNILINRDVVVLADNDSVSQYQSYTDDTEDNSILRLDIDVQKEQAQELLTKTKNLNSVANLVLDEQRKLAYKYEDIPLDTKILNKILIESEKNNIDPDVMISIYHTESRFDDSANNENSSARGLGQILISTGEWAYKEIYGEDSYYSHSYAYNAETNIEMSCYIIGYYHNLYNDNDYYQTITAYRGSESREYYDEIMKYANSLKSRRKEV